MENISKDAVSSEPVAPVQAKPEKAKAKAKPEKPKADKPKKVAKPTKKALEWADGFRDGSIAADVADLIVEGRLDNKAILEKVKAKHKGSKTTYSCVAWYRSKFNRDMK